MTLDLKNDPELIREYEEHHQAVWPEIVHSIRSAGVYSMEIYRYDTRLVMFMEVPDDFDFGQKAEADQNNPAVQAWENLMWKYQQALPVSRPGEKWMLMDKIFELDQDGVRPQPATNR